MGKRTIVGAASGLLMVVVLGVAWQSFHSAHSTDAVLLRLLAQRGRLDSEIKKAERRLAEAQRSRLGLETRRDAVINALPSTPTRKSVPSEDAMLRSNAKLQALYLNNVRAQQRINRAPFYHAIGLSPEQIRNLEEIEMQATERKMDLRWAAEAQGTRMADPAYLAMQQQVTDQADAETASLLGAAGFQQLQGLIRSMPVTYVVGQAGATLAQSETPLSADQATQLTQLLANASSDYQAGKTASLTSIDWDVALMQAQGIIAAPQVEALRTTIAKYQEAQAYSKLIQLAARSRKN